MKNVIITGTDGFVGGYTVKHFSNEGKTVLALDMSPSALRLKEHLTLYRKHQNDCGFIPEVSYAQGIKFTMDWLKII